MNLATIKNDYLDEMEQYLLFFKLKRYDPNGEDCVLEYWQKYQQSIMFNDHYIEKVNIDKYNKGFKEIAQLFVFMYLNILSYLYFLQGNNRNDLYGCNKLLFSGTSMNHISYKSLMTYGKAPAGKLYPKDDFYSKYYKVFGKNEIKLIKIILAYRWYCTTVWS